MGYQEHRSAAGQRAVACAVITCSDSRTADTDTSGNLIRSLLAEAGHAAAFSTITRDDPAAIRELLQQLTVRQDIQAIILNGGTGISPRDNTFDAVSALLTKTLPGFGELFRVLSYETIGSGALLSRAIAGIILAPSERAVLVFSIPGSPQAVEIAMRKLILPELAHLIWETLR